MYAGYEAKHPPRPEPRGSREPTLSVPARHQDTRNKKQTCSLVATSRSIPSLAFTIEHGGALALLSRPAKLLLPGAMNPYDLRFADPSSYHDRRRYANPNSSSSDLI